MSGNKILLIGDDHDLVLGLSHRMKVNGYVAISAMDGVSAIAVALTEAPDLLILDLGMAPAGGFLFIDRLTALIDFLEIPIIVLGPPSPSGTEQSVLDAGAVAFLEKPPDHHALMTAIRRALRDDSVR